MAGYQSLIKLKGTLHDLTFYTYRGRQVVRAKSSLDKNRVMKSPEFANSRQAMKEFGAASSIGKDIRSALGAFRKTHTDGQAVNRLNSQLLKIIQSAPGEKGKRSFSLAGNDHTLRGFELSSKDSFGNRYKAPLGLHYNLLGDHLHLRFGPFRPEENLKAPSGTTHFRLEILLLTLSDYEWNESSGKYGPVHSEVHLKQLRLNTDWQALTKDQLRLEMETDLAGDFAPRKGVSILVFGAITFGIGGKQEIMASGEGAAMALLDVKA